MLRANWAVRLLIGIAAINFTGVHAMAQQGLKPPRAAAGEKQPGALPPNLKLSPLAKEWFDPAARSALSDGKRSITVLEDDDVWHDDLAALRFLPEVNRLCLMGGFSGKDFARLNGLKSLEYLRIESNVFVSDQDLEDIATLPNLRGLEILQAFRSGGDIRDISDRGLEILSQLPHLQVLELGNVGITENGLRHLKKFPELRELTLASTKLTWDSLSKFPKLDKLYSLTILCVPWKDGFLHMRPPVESVDRPGSGHGTGPRASEPSLNREQR